MAMLLSAFATAQTTVRVTSTDGSLAAVVGVSGIASLQIDGAAQGWPAVRAVSLRAVHPGGAVRDLGKASAAPGGVWEAVVPLERGCAMVRVAMRNS